MNDYLSKYINAIPIDFQEYKSERPYYLFWKKCHQLLDEGISKDSIEVILESEKLLLIRDNEISKDEIQTIVTIEKITCIIHSGDLYKAADIIQYFATSGIKIKYAKTLEFLHMTEAVSNDTVKCYTTSLNTNEQDSLIDTKNKFKR
jgi:hypothetical protein